MVLKQNKSAFYITQTIMTPPSPLLRGKSNNMHTKKDNNTDNTETFSNHSVFISFGFQSIHFGLHIQMFAFSWSFSSFPCKQETISLRFQMKKYPCNRALMNLQSPTKVHRLLPPHNRRASKSLHSKTYFWASSSHVMGRTKCLSAVAGKFCLIENILRTTRYFYAV